MVDVYKVDEVNERTVKNNAGGDVFQLDELKQLERFLILGSASGTFYVGKHDLTKENLGVVTRALNEHGARAVDLIVEIGVSNRAPKHDPVLLALALAVSSDNAEARAAAMANFNKLVRTGTHLFNFLSYAKGRRGWGRAFRRMIANWYLEKNEQKLAYQLLKYKSRGEWSHRDVLRLAHPQSQSAEQNALLKFAVGGTLDAMDTEAHRFVEAAIEATHSEDVNRVIDLVREFNLPMEVINTKFKNHPLVWEALAPQMGMTALLRNLRNMHKDGYLVQGSDAVRVVRERLLDAEQLRRARIHPAHIFVAQRNARDIPQPVRDALEDGFFLSFGNVEPTNKRMMLAIDTSGSMTWDQVGVATPAEWAALQAMVTARVEPYAEFRTFSTGMGRLNINRHQSLDEVTRVIRQGWGGGTDVSLPMLAARVDKEKFDAFCIYTDNETWARGWSHNGHRSSGNAMKELKMYRKASGIHDAKLIVIGMATTGFTVADPRDVNTLDVVGFDADAPAILADFIRG